MSTSAKYEIDMCNGPLFGKIMVFYIPLMLSGILQLFFNAADIIVAGRFAGNEALAAVGSTSSLINLMVNLFTGLSVGANVLVAHFHGAGQKRELSEVVHTAITASLVSGVLLVIVGVGLSRTALLSMGTPPDVIDQAVLYLRIYFFGMPVMMVYNFGSAILRAVGDTRRPLYYLLLAGAVNVVLNLFFVIVFSLGVAGVALATVISQTISAVLVVRCLMLTDGDYRLNLKKLRITPNMLRKIMQIGLPAGIQGSLFSISNVLIQSTINTFGSVAMAGNTAAGNLEGFIYTAMNAFSQASVSFVGQNYGAHKFKRILKVNWICLGLTVIVGLLMGGFFVLFAEELLGLYSQDPTVIQYGVVRMYIICTTYFLCGMMEVVVGVLRGMGHAVVPMLVSLSGACLLRIAWVYLVFPHFGTLENLYCSYPISWLVTFIVQLLYFFVIFRRAVK